MSAKRVTHALWLITSIAYFHFISASIIVWLRLSMCSSKLVLSTFASSNNIEESEDCTRCRSLHYGVLRAFSVTLRSGRSLWGLVSTEVFRACLNASPSCLTYSIRASRTGQFEERVLSATESVLNNLSIPVCPWMSESLSNVDTFTANIRQTVNWGRASQNGTHHIWILQVTCLDEPFRQNHL